MVVMAKVLQVMEEERRTKRTMTFDQLERTLS